jgi:hypothetical protein
MRKVKTHGVRRNMSWLELGSRIMKIDLLHRTIQNVARGAGRRGMKWFAYRLTEVDKYGGRQPYGQWLWIPKANLIGHVSIAPPGSGGFIQASGPNLQYVVQWERGHPLARTVKEVWHAYHWGHSRRGRLQRYGGGDVSNAPLYEHWLEAREVAKREGRTIPSWDEWSKEMSGPFHHAWWARGRTSKGNCGKNPGRRCDGCKRATTVHQRMDWPAVRTPSGKLRAPWYCSRCVKVRKNPGRITIQYYRDRSGVIRHWGTGAKGTLPDRHVLLVDYKHGGIFDTWMEDGARTFELVKVLDNPRRKRRR